MIPIFSFLHRVVRLLLSNVSIIKIAIREQLIAVGSDVLQEESVPEILDHRFGDNLVDKFTNTQRLLRNKRIFFYDLYLVQKQNKIL